MTNTYYTYEIPTAEGEFEQVTRYYEPTEARSMLAVVARIFCFSDCTDERVLDIQVQGRKVRYCGWQPGMVYRFVFADNGELAGEFCFPSMGSLIKGERTMMEDRDMDTIAEELVPSNPIILPEVKNSLDDEKKKSSIPHLYMWDANGNPVDDTESAHFVWLENQAAAQYFLEAAEHEGDQLCEGIEEEDTGLFMWNSWNLEYQPVQTPKGLIRVLTFLQTFGKF